MQTEIERPRFRVRMRMPNLGPQAAPPAPNASTPVATPWPDLPLSPEAPVQQPGDGARSHTHSSEPSDLSRFRSPLAVIVGLAVFTAALVAWGNRYRRDPAPIIPSTAELDAKPTGLGGKPGAILGGSPSELMNIPELTLPGVSQAGGARPKAGESGRVERLPPVPPECQPPVGFDLSSQAPGSNPLGFCGYGDRVPGETTPGMARLERRIETPTSEVPYDATRQSLY